MFCQVFKSQRQVLSSQTQKGQFSLQPLNHLLSTFCWQMLTWKTNMLPPAKSTPIQPKLSTRKAFVPSYLSPRIPLPVKLYPKQRTRANRNSPGHGAIVSLCAIFLSQTFSVNKPSNPGLSAGNFQSIYTATWRAEFCSRQRYETTHRSKH